MNLSETEREQLLSMTRSRTVGAAVTGNYAAFLNRRSISWRGERRGFAA